MKSKNDYHFRPQTNGRSCPRHGRIPRSPSSPLAEGRAFHPVGDSSRAAMERGHPSTDPRRGVKGHTQLHQHSLAVSAAVSSEQTTNHSLLRKRKSSPPSLLLLSHKTLWVLRGPKTGQELSHAAFVLTVQLNRDRFQGYGRQRRQGVAS